MIYLSVFYTRYHSLDEIERISVYYMIKNKKKIFASSSFPLGSYLKFHIGLLIFPFFNQENFINNTKGGIYGYYIYEHYPLLTDLLNDKLFWAKLFMVHDINHPKLVAFKKKYVFITYRTQ